MALRVRAYGLVNGRGLATLILVPRDGGAALWPGIDIASFVAAGLIAYAACHAAFEAMASSLVFDKMEGMVQDVLSAPLTAAETLAGWVLGAALSGLASGSA